MGPFGLGRCDLLRALDFVCHLLSLHSIRSAGLWDFSGKQREHANYLRDCNWKTTFCFTSLLFIEQTLVQMSYNPPEKANLYNL